MVTMQTFCYVYFTEVNRFPPDWTTSDNHITIVNILVYALSRLL
jgi:hypothetical protein